MNRVTTLSTRENHMPTNGWRGVARLALVAATLVSAAIAEHPVDAPPPPRDVTAFYNVFSHNHAASMSPGARTAMRRTPAIIQQQLAELKRSPAWPSIKEIRFATIGSIQGRETVLEACKMAEIGASKCVHIGHVGEGNEAVTLKLLHNFCKATTNATVLYMHNKGSFHPMTSRPPLSVRNLFI